MRIWFKLGVVEVPVPPLPTGNIPETWEPRATCPLYKEPLAVDWTMPPALREVMVVEPLTTRVCPGVDVPMPT